MPVAQLEDFGSGLTPVTQGWFGVNVRDAEWWFSERRGARCASFLLVFRARDFPALPAVPASLLDGKEGVDGSSPSEGFSGSYVLARL